jgi:hypothetical protein
MASEYNEKVFANCSYNNLLCSYGYMYYCVAACYQSIVYYVSCHCVPASVSRLLQSLSRSIVQQCSVVKSSVCCILANSSASILSAIQLESPPRTAVHLTAALLYCNAVVCVMYVNTAVTSSASSEA